MVNYPQDIYAPAAKATRATGNAMLGFGAGLLVYGLGTCGAGMQQHEKISRAATQAVCAEGLARAGTPGHPADPNSQAWGQYKAKFYDAQTPACHENGAQVRDSLYTAFSATPNIVAMRAREDKYTTDGLTLLVLAAGIGALGIVARREAKTDTE